MTHTREHHVGDLVAERFELLAHLGAGGMGTVWRARDLLLEREVALKEMRSPALTDPGLSFHTRERVLREARALARIRHTKVVTVHEILDQRPCPWLVMELVEGRSLHGLLQDGPLTPARAARVGLDVLGALEAAHAAGILHRDVKPGNILIRPDGTAVLTDFGIATLQGSQTLTAPGDLVGSPEYMAPERLRGGLVGPASDLWSLGVLLHVCVDGDNPVRRDSVWQTLLAVCEQPIPSPRRAGPLTPVIEALLRRHPGERPSAPRLAVLLAEVARSDRTTAGTEPDTVLLPRTTATTRVESPTLVAVPKHATHPAESAAAPLPTGTAPARRGRRRPLLMPAVLSAAALTAITAYSLAGPGHHREGAAPSPVDTRPGNWIAQLAEIPHSTDSDERDEDFSAIQRQVPGAALLDGDNWASLPSGQWIVRAPGNFADGYEALAYCTAHGHAKCSGRYLSDDQADRSYLCEAGPAQDPESCRRPGDRPGTGPSRPA